MTTTKKYLYAIGRRRTAVARVRLFHGKGENLVNGQPAVKYFPGLINQKLFFAPFETCNLLDKYYATIKVVGSGKLSQLQACVHGLARALIKVKADFKPVLRARGFITRDPRTRQRRMVGTGGKSRRQKQSPKR